MTVYYYNDTVKNIRILKEAAYGCIRYRVVRKEEWENKGINRREGKWLYLIKKAPVVNRFTIGTHFSIYSAYYLSFFTASKTHVEIDIVQTLAINHLTSIDPFSCQ